jgi:DNA-binding NarL/FixJ family response regulator
MSTGSESPNRSNEVGLGLTRRKYSVGLRPLGADEWSAWVEHAGEGWYVPLGTRDEVAAQRQADDVRRQVQQSGWSRLGPRIPREITLTIFWLEAPLACTYSTLFTLPTTALAASAGGRGLRIRTVVVEPDLVFRRAIVHWLESVPGCTVTGFGSLHEMNEAPRRSANVDVVFANRVLAPMIGETPAAQARSHREPAGPLMYSYGLYPSSDHIFMGFSGVEGGYLLRRRPLANLFEPLEGAFGSGRLLPDEAPRAIRRYCQGLFSPGAAGVDASVRSSLTVRERQILACLQRGLHDKEIAVDLGISPLTVHTHLKHIFEKLGAHTRTEAVVKYLEK